MKVRKQNVKIGIWIILVLGFTLMALRFNHVFEDAYISFRYAKHLAAGQGLNYNPGAYVEGYSNFFWVILLALFCKCGVGLPMASKFLGYLFGLLTLGATYGFSRTLLEERGGRSNYLPFLSLIPLLLMPHFGFWTLSGMETPQFVFFVTLSFWLYSFNKTNRFVVSMAPLALLFMALSRPEGNFFAFLILLYAAWKRIRSKMPPINRYEFYLLILPLAAYQSWRISYYGYLMPNSFYAKYGFDPSHLAVGIFDYLKLFVWGGLASLYILPLILIFFFKEMRRHAWIVTVIYLFIGIITYMGGDIYPFSRYFLPIVPVSLVLFFHLIFYLWERWRRYLFKGGILAYCALFILLLHPPGYSIEMGRYQSGRNNDLERLDFIHNMAYLFHPGERIAIQDAGIIPFYLDLYTVDMIGLNDDVIGHQKMKRKAKGTFGHEKHDAFHILLKRPTWVFFVLHQWDTKIVRYDLPDSGEIPFSMTYPFVVMRFIDYPAQSRLWEEPSFKLKYVPTVYTYGTKRIILYQLDEPTERLVVKGLHSSLTEDEEEILISRFIQKGIYMEGETYLMDLVKRGHGDQKILDRYRRSIRQVEENRMKAYQAMRHELSLYHSQRIEEALRSKDYDSARWAIQRANRLYPENFHLWDARGIYYLETAHYELARQWFTTIINQGRATPALWTNLGVAWVHLGDIQQARIAWIKALKIDPSFAPARQNLSNLQRKK